MASLNNESLEINEYRIDKFALRDYFEAFFSSCYLGLRKPDPGIYKLALKITQQKPAECILIDDRGLNLEVARELGMQTILFEDLAQLRNQLAGFNISFSEK
jgi:putative hydrolase of the HAD superfamily